MSPNPDGSGGRSELALDLVSRLNLSPDTAKIFGNMEVISPLP